MLNNDSLLLTGRQDYTGALSLRPAPPPAHVFPAVQRPGAPSLFCSPGLPPAFLRATVSHCFHGLGRMAGHMFRAGIWRASSLLVLLSCHRIVETVEISNPLGYFATVFRHLCPHSCF